MNKVNLAKIFTILHRLNISFTLIGGYAVAAWGVVRATRDIDLLVAAPGAMASRLANALKKAGFKVDYQKGDEKDPVLGTIRLDFLETVDAEPVEIILGIKKMPAAIFMRARRIPFFGLEVPVTSPEDLIVLKCLAGGPIDLEDARTIYLIMNKKLDMEYLKSEFKRCRLSLEKLRIK